MSLRKLAVSLFLLVVSARPGRAADVATLSDLRAAIDSAQPGSTIHLASGLWKVGSSVATKVAGTADKPITITADSAAAVRLDFSADEGLVIAHPYWVVEKVWLNGVCNGCASSGMHLQPGADHLIVRNVRITNFATGIKAERTAAAEISDVAVQGNELYNDAGQRAAGSSPLDIVGGKRWVISGNYIHDYGGTAPHPAVTVRGGSADATIEQNLIAGAKALAAAGMAAGLSLGGAGTMPDACAADNRGATSCTCEVSLGMVRNNIIAHGGTAGVAANLACGTKIENNNIYDTTPGLQLAMAGSMPVDVRFNVFSGEMVGVPVGMNLASVSAANYKMNYLDPDNLDFYQGANDKLVNDLTPANPDVPLDYVGLMRHATLDWGSMELPTTIHTWPWAGAAMIGTAAVPTMEIPPGSVDAGTGNDAPASATGGAGGSGGPSPADGGAGSGSGGQAGNAGNGSGGQMAGGTSGGASSGGGGCAIGGKTMEEISIAASALLLGCALFSIGYRRRR